MNKLLPASCKLYANLARLDKPIGIWLLFLPCLFGIALSYKQNSNFDLIFTILLFFSGSIIMRSAGCIINDLIDRKFDKKVSRTKSRPLASSQIKVWQALILLLILLSAGLIILLQFNLATILLGATAVFLVILYPFTKRFTYYPQIFLGLTFNIGILMASTAILGKITFPALFLFISAIFWTLIYDTIYAYQDLEDDIKIGVKSTAIKFGKNPRKILYIFIALQILFLALTNLALNQTILYYCMLIIVQTQLICLVRKCDFSNPQDCLKKFKSNIWIGILILATIILG